MERDRFRTNEWAYVVGMICLAFSLALFAFSFYIMPHLLFGWHYRLPDFITIWSTTLQESYQFSERGAAWALFLGYFLPAVLFAVMADILSNRIDRQIYGMDRTDFNKKTREVEDDEGSRYLVFKIIAIIILVFIAAEFFRWMISSPLHPM